MSKSIYVKGIFCIYVHMPWIWHIYLKIPYNCSIYILSYTLNADQLGTLWFCPIRDENSKRKIIYSWSTIFRPSNIPQNPLCVLLHRRSLLPIHSGMQDNETKRNYQNKTKTVLKKKSSWRRKWAWETETETETGRGKCRKCGGKSKQFLQQLRWRPGKGLHNWA